MLKTLISFLREDFAVNISAEFEQRKKITISGSGNPSSKGFLLNLVLQKKYFKKIFWLVDDFSQAQEVKNNFHFWFKDFAIFLQKKEEICLANFLYQIQNNQPQIFIFTKEDFLAPTPDPKEVQDNEFNIEVGAEFDLIYLVNVLTEMGYQTADEPILKSGEFLRAGNVLTIFPFNNFAPVKIEFEGDKVEHIFLFNESQAKELSKKLDKITLLPKEFSIQSGHFKDFINQARDLIVFDELNEPEDVMMAQENFYQLFLTSFPEEEERHNYLRFLSVLKFQTVLDFITDLKEKLKNKWQIVVYTRRAEELTNILKEKGIFIKKFSEHTVSSEEGGVFFLPDGVVKKQPTAFQNPRLKIIFLTDSEVFGFQSGQKSVSQEKAYLEFIASLKTGDFVVHIDHGIGQFFGIERHTVDEITREYLQIGYAEGDKLYVPIDQADKVSKYIGVGDTEPKLTRLGSVEWSTVTKKAKEETEKIAKELLAIFAKRATATGQKLLFDTQEQAAFEKTFPYEETPGQLKAIEDTKKDMELEKPMDRLICGDVGFGKTEVALRAAFKAVQNKKSLRLLF